MRMSLSPTSLLTSFARVLSAACAERGIAREQLARDSGIAVEILAAMEAGQHAPTLEELVMLAQGLGGEVGELIDRTMAGYPHDDGDELSL